MKSRPAFSDLSNLLAQIVQPGGISRRSPSPPSEHACTIRRSGATTGRRRQLMGALLSCTREEGVVSA